MGEERKWISPIPTSTTLLEKSVAQRQRRGTEDPRATMVSRRVWGGLGDGTIPREHQPRFGEVPKAPDSMGRKARSPRPLNCKVQREPWGPMTALYHHFTDKETSSESNGNLATGTCEKQGKPEGTPDPDFKAQSPELEGELGLLVPLSPKAAQ